MPPQTTTDVSDSKKRKCPPSCSRPVLRHRRTRGHTSRSSAAIIAISGITLRPEPSHCTSQSFVYRRDLPSQLPFCLLRRDEHFLSSHAHCINRSARLSPANPTRKGFVHNARGQRQHIRHLHFWRRQAGDGRKLVQNLLQCQIFSAENVTLAASSLRKRRNRSP